jgi:hypothetical protein
MVRRTKMLSPKLFVIALIMIFAVVAGLPALVGAIPSPGWDIQIVDSERMLADAHP